MSEDHQQELAKITYQDAGREVTQQFSTLYSNLTLASGLLTALLAVLGAGELFKGSSAPTQLAPRTIAGIPALSPVSLIVLVLVFPLLVRFLVRSMIAYNNLLRFNKIRDASWKFLQGQSQWRDFSSTYCLYQLKWKSPETVLKSIWSNMKYGYMWLFAVFVAAIVWGFVTTTGGWRFRLIAGVALILGLGWEAWSLNNSRKRYFTLPTCEDCRECESICESETEAVAIDTGPDESKKAGLLERSSGIFVGRQIRERRT